jgi:uroporphyrin-III C-methyltransferase
VVFVTLAQGTENLAPGKPIANPNADTLVYYMGRKDASRIAKQLIKNTTNHTAATPVVILEAVSTARERQWFSTLGELAQGHAEQWFDSQSPALIMIGQSLGNPSQNNLLETPNKSLESASAKIHNSLQNSQVLANRRRRA